MFQSVTLTLIVTIAFLYSHFDAVSSALTKHHFFVLKHYNGELGFKDTAQCAIACAQLDDCHAFDVTAQNCITRKTYIKDDTNQTWQYILKSLEDSLPLATLTADKVRSSSNKSILLVCYEYRINKM